MNKIDNNIAVEFKNVTKIYKLFETETQRLLSLIFNLKNYQEKLASDNLNFQIKRGESVAFFGRNGAGKSTLLKMLAHVTYPTSGEITINGKISSLIEMGAGFNNELTGIENIYLKLQLMGYTRAEVAGMVDEIIDFAELGIYATQPIRTYSSGMRAKLGFSCATCINPDILIVDEALSTGDTAFRQKANDRIDKIMSQENLTFLFVTHSAGEAEKFCKRGMVIENGKILFDGEVKAAYQEYLKSLK
jgi:teichoic acid transport system ATP-binding protein